MYMEEEGREEGRRGETGVGEGGEGGEGRETYVSTAELRCTSWPLLVPMSWRR